ncbi:MAG: molybdopterin biosynthesis protein [Anaerolineaceae bacterium]|nr:molybdopterin biosynthesis protein [Anaerolineaceae bacterium]
MAFDYLTNFPIDEARTKYLDALRQTGLELQAEPIQTSAALHRVCSRAVYARISAPHYNACAMDGISLNAKLTFGASETTPVTLRQADFIWVNTGDPLPDGHDCVIMVEDVIQQNDQVLLYAPATPWQHIRQIGEDISAGDMILPSFTRITPAMQGALLAAGVLELEVFKALKVGFIPSGNELVPPSSNPKPGDIIEFNSTIFKGILEEWDCQVKVYPIVKDEQALVEKALNLAFSENDLIILNAGSSAGRKDFATDAFKAAGTVCIHGIAIKPGKPAILGMKQSEGRTVPMIGLPGYPVSGILVMEEIIKPLIDLMNHQPTLQKTVLHPILSRKLMSSLKYKEYIRAQLGEVNGKSIAVPLNRGAGVVSSFIKADGMIEVPQNVEGYEAGDAVDLSLLKDFREIKDALVVTGSHDPMVDEIADLMKRCWASSRVSSSHVGSMGGIMAVKRGEAHLGGIHLLDENSGTYNIPYLQKYFPFGHVVLLRGVLRTQGIMVANGNPLKVKSIADFAGLRYVNRQKGSGTRILLDYLLKNEKMPFSQIIGYQREEFTHTAVAAAIAAGTGDAGMGIYSAAKIYGLDFLPLWEESYDFLVLEDAMSLESMQRFREVLAGKELKARLEKLGGYKTENPGEIIQWN